VCRKEIGSQDVGVAQRGMFSYKVRQGKAFSGGSKNTGQENKVVAW